MVYIAPTAYVSSHDNVYDEARVEDYAMVNHNAVLVDEAQVYGNAKVLSNSIFKTVILADDCHVFGDANVDISHFPDNTKLILGSGCKIGGQFDMREFVSLDAFMAEYKNNSDVEYEDHNTELEVGLIDYDDDRYGEESDLMIDYDDPKSPYRVLCVTVTNIWFMS